MTELNIESLQSTVENVVVVSKALDAAVQLEREARILVMRQVIDVVRPALKALCSRIETSQFARNLKAGGTHEKSSYYSEKGVYLDKNRVGPSRGSEFSAGEGEYSGADLFLLQNGGLLRLRYEGGWSQWQGATSEWSTQATLVDALSAADELVRLNRDGDAIAALSQALQQQLDGEAKNQTAAALERAAKLRAIVELTK